ncbi:class A beta-lactamase-related serine hydrolase [Desertihabitans brevis]|uniref:Class A beta-lactamase-related serine hydrolase n=1 Tax=Desertihabitans brevis TaxID=2268447 RepID=A0A367YWJ3_9ACTN|nr:serine hydrolase domain-containing protein [Desertihabitans brevis]RCK70244.1 class A beta-lactamase-related serine hydrolase [Desertihabitans brevis]
MTLADELAALAEELAIPGAAVGVVHQGRSEIAVSGWTRVEGGTPITPATLFQIGSVAKSFTATAVMVLVEQGRVALDRPVSAYLPGVRLPAEVDVLDLLNHTAGWDGMDSWPDTGEGDDAITRVVDLLADLPQRFPPRSAAAYNNASFVLAGRLVEEVTGTTFDRALAELVLTPLGLTQTSSELDVIMTRPFAVGRRSTDGADVTTWSGPRGWVPAGARLSCSTTDLLAWAAFQLGEGTAPDGTRVLASDSLRAMGSASTPHEVMPGVGIGLGWMLRQVDGTRLLEHSGDVSGQHASVTVAPERGFAVVVLTNAAPAGRQLSERLTTSVLASRLDLSETSPEVVQRSAADLAPYTGTFRAEGIELEVRSAGSGLVIRGTIIDDDGTSETVEFPLQPLPDDRFLVADGPFAGLQSAFVRTGQVVTAVHHLGRLVPRQP